MTDAELVITGLLREGAKYAYEIDQHIRERRLREWANIAFSSVYALLHRAERAGWARSQSGPGRRGPRTKRYRLTALGRNQLREAVLARLHVPVTPAGVELALMFAGVLDAATFVQALQGFAAQCHQAAAQARAQWEYMPDTPYRVYSDAIFDHSVALLEAQAAWAERTVQRLLDQER